MATDAFGDVLRTGRGTAQSSASGSSAGGSADTAEVLRQGIEMASEGLALIHAAVDVESENDGSEPLPETLPGSLEDEYEALADALADFANAAADVIGETIEIVIPED